MKPAARPEVMSYLAVRRALGLLGLFLPVSLYIYARIFGKGMQPSISEFYHTEMGDIVVGVLISIGVFLIAYKGYPRQNNERFSDRIVARIAGLGVIGVAVLPAASPSLVQLCSQNEVQVLTVCNRGITVHWSGFEWIHFASAGVFFLCMAVFCFALFPRGHRMNEQPNRRINWKPAENKLYFICGAVIVASIIALVIYAVLDRHSKETLRESNYVFWWESVGVVSFAIAWLAKGKSVRGILNLVPFDRQRTH